MSMTYKQAQEVLALSAEHDGDPTPEMVEATRVIVEQTRINEQSEAYLRQTDWIAAKYTDQVVINQNMTDADFKTKYADILARRSEARDAIVK